MERFFSLVSDFFARGIHRYCARSNRADLNFKLKLLRSEQRNKNIVQAIRIAQQVPCYLQFHYGGWFTEARSAIERMLYNFIFHKIHVYTYTGKRMHRYHALLFRVQAPKRV